MENFQAIPQLRKTETKFIVLIRIKEKEHLQT